MSHHKEWHHVHSSNAFWTVKGLSWNQRKRSRPCKAGSRGRGEAVWTTPVAQRPTPITVVAGSLRKLRPSLTSAPIYIRLKNVIGFPATWVRENEEICQRPKWRIRRLFNRCENSLRGRRPFSLFNSKKEHFQFRRCRQRDTQTRNRKERSFCTRSMNQKLYLFSLYANETARIQKGERERDCEFLKRGNKLKRVVSFFIATIDHLENSINIFSLHKFSFFFRETYEAICTHLDNLRFFIPRHPRWRQMTNRNVCKRAVSTVWNLPWKKEK